MTLRNLATLTGALKDGATDEPVASVLREAEAGRTAKYHAYSQLDDWPHPGDHPIMCAMGLNVYSMWVYRTKVSPCTVSDERETNQKPKHVDAEAVPRTPRAETGRHEFRVRGEP